MTVQTPPMEKSGEASRHELDLAREQGEVYRKALRHMARDVAHDGGEREAGDYVVAYAVEEAEGLWRRRGGELVWEAPEEENCHVEVSVRDRADHRFLPGLEVEATLLDGDGTEVGTHPMPFLWHPWLYHYGRNWKVPGDGVYTLRVRIAAPDFHRHDEKNGRRYAEDVEVEFPDVEIATGRD